MMARLGGFEVRVPLGQRYERHQRGSLPQGAAWDAFVDPRETTYAKHVAMELLSLGVTPP